VDVQLAEAFLTLQGEGVDSGLPCFLVRLTGCNLRCRYCDTRYALAGGAQVPVSHLIEIAKEIGVELVCVTGGEPLVQRGLQGLLEGLLDEGFHVTVETNGTLPLRRLPAGITKVVDVKTPGSGNAGTFYQPNLREVGPGDQLKFVLADRHDYLWASSRIRSWRLGSHGEEILMSPAHGLLDPGRLGDWILADGLPVRLQVQLHKYLWPGQRR
jgi:7-carboxy-7-deazaguanine synthase